MLTLVFSYKTTGPNWHFHAGNETEMSSQQAKLGGMGQVSLPCCKRRVNWPEENELAEKRHKQIRSKGEKILHEISKSKPRQLFAQEQKGVSISQSTVPRHSDLGCKWRHRTQDLKAQLWQQCYGACKQTTILCRLLKRCAAGRPSLYFCANLCLSVVVLSKPYQ